jgi:quercetin dioxygenase-like cupin family protein
MDQTDIFPKGDLASADYFTGTAWVKILLSSDAELPTQIYDVTFEPGARNHWHSHPGGQILIVTQGKGYYQEKGKPRQVICRGDVVRIPADVVHWHGATADSAMTHIAIIPNTQPGTVAWMQAVTDEEYAEGN